MRLCTQEELLSYYSFFAEFFEVSAEVMPWKRCRKFSMPPVQRNRREQPKFGKSSLIICESDEVFRCWEQINVVNNCISFEIYC